jgi:hypothetical protein
MWVSRGQNLYRFEVRPLFFFDYDLDGDLDIKIYNHVVYLCISLVETAKL